jgi:hypothetical protein
VCWGCELEGREDSLNIEGRLMLSTLGKISTTSGVRVRGGGGGVGVGVGFEGRGRIRRR